MASFKDYQAAAQMRDIIKTLVREEMEATRPVYAYATVASIDRTARRATVVFPDSADPVPVQMGAMQPQSVGQTVRVDGIAGDRYISEVLGSGHLEAADIVANSLVTLGTARIEVDSGTQGGIIWYRDNVPVAQAYGATGGGIVITATTSGGSSLSPHINLDNGNVQVVGQGDAALLALDGDAIVQADDDVTIFADNGDIYAQATSNATLSSTGGNTYVQSSSSAFVTSTGGSVVITSQTSQVVIDAEDTIFIESNSGNVQVTAGSGILLQSDTITMFASDDIVLDSGSDIFLDANSIYIDGQLENLIVGGGFIISSLSGQRWLVGVDNGGNVQTTAV